MSRNHDRRGAFTLVELLVTVSIIALLISVLLPSLRGSRRMARKTQCLARLKAVGVAKMMYVNDFGRFPDLNNLPDDGAWQYNYLIYDGADFDNNFGPLVRSGGEIEYIEQFFCPVQKDPYHTLATNFNSWPVVKLLDTRAGYGRRYHLSGKSLAQIKRTVGLAADVFHLPKVVKSAHKKGVNAVYTDGHAQWVPDPGIFTDNELSHPFDPVDNAVIEDIWDAIDEAS
ncbi:MAG: type II secretion system protein [bacterium]|nr:type II secretion system protein [bacterium]